MLAMLLQFSGHETHMANDGMEAVEATTTLQPDVILLDIGLPHLNGYDEDRRRTEEAGFETHLVKPVDEAALGKLLDDLGARKHAVESVPALQHTSA